MWFFTVYRHRINRWRYGKNNSNQLPMSQKIKNYSKLTKIRELQLLLYLLELV